MGKMHDAVLALVGVMTLASCSGQESRVGVAVVNDGAARGATQPRKIDPDCPVASDVRLGVVYKCASGESRKGTWKGIDQSDVPDSQSGASAGGIASPPPTPGATPFPCGADGELGCLTTDAARADGTMSANQLPGCNHFDKHCVFRDLVSSLMVSEPGASTMNGS